ncbi:MAG TPA: tripartite tricarboxylate transporter TctB family protein [Hyphomicrobiaceae bacterium]|nr:tripartite tricarboxylate transporter TctB family protein [Hyphomicrobiaceae bacterium]
MNDADHSQDRGIVSKRSMEIVVALLFLVVSGVVIADSLRLGMGWESDGPEPGYFPFYIAVAMAAASLVNLYRAAIQGAGSGIAFVSGAALLKIILVLVPLLVYVGAIGSIGIYVASAIYVALFMWYFGGYAIWKGVLTGTGIAVALFFMFERWFLVPLPKGPLEAWLGY